MKQVKRNLFPIAVVVGVVGLICISFIDTRYRIKDDAGIMMAQDIARLSDVFHRIDKACTIIDFDAQKNPINFLNVARFSGSEVGPMNLVHPEKWEGPYLKDNPTIYHTAYQVVSTKKGYYITPGDGVKLPNSKVVGRDIVLDKNADILAMMRDPQALSYKDKPLAARIDLGGDTSNMQFFFAEIDEE
jgi:hypothetical protein